jgi:hypothetical protein
MQNEIEINSINFVKSTLLINYFCKIQSLCGNDCQIIPLKGMSLLFSIYKDSYARNMGDIDIFVSENNLKLFISSLKELGYTFRNQNIQNRLYSKQKFDMIHTDKKICDLDIHINLINKKFFRTSIGDFATFALNRLRTIKYNEKTISLLLQIDEWLYLAQHYCFHLFSNNKWLIDLYLLQLKFSKKEIDELVAVAKMFHFERIVTAVSRILKETYSHEEIKIPELITKRHCIFDVVFHKSRYKCTNAFTNRLIAVYWEFIFIDNFSSRLKAYLHLLFPRLKMLSDMYNSRSKTIIFAYPFHLCFVLLSSVLFLLVYTFR